MNKDDVSTDTESLRTKVVQLEELRAKYESMVEAFDGLIYICSSDYKVEFMNRRFIERTGRNAVGENCFEALHGLKSVCPWCVNDRVFQGETVRHEILSPKDQHWYYVVNTPIPHPDGSVSKMGMINDITDRKCSEHVLLARLRLVEYATSHSLDELLQATLDEVEALTESSIGFYHFLDTDQRTLHLQAWSTRTLLEMCTAEGKGLHYDIDKAGVWADCVRERMPVIHNDYSTLPHHHGMPAGHADVIRELVVPVFRGDHVVAILGVGNKAVDYDASDIETVSLLADLAWDIAEHKQAEERLRLLDFAMDHVSEAAFLIDENSCFRFVNEESCRILGYPRSELLGLGVPDVDPDFPMERWSSHWEDLKNHGSLMFEGRHKTKDDRIFPVEISANYFEYEGQAYNLALVRNITERKQAEQERLANLRFFETMDRINRAIQGTNDVEQMMSDVLDTVLSIFDCDRVFLMYPCDPQAATWTVPMEKTKPEYPGVLDLRLEIPMDEQVAEILHFLLNSDGPVKFGSEIGHALPEEVSETFGVKALMSMVLYPKVDKPWEFGIQQCSYSRVWTREEERLFQEIGRRLEDGLNTLLVHRNLRENMRKLEEVQRIAHIGHWDRDLDSDLVTLSEEACRIFGLPVEERTYDLARWQECWLELIHPDDRAGVVQAATDALQGSPLLDMEYRVVRPNGEIAIVYSFGEISRDRFGRSQRMFATIQDITERKQVERERLANLRFFESMDQINRAIQGTNDLEQMMSDVLNIMLSIFDCDRAFLMYPCDPQAATWTAPMEKTKPEYPGALDLGLEMPMDEQVAETLRILLNSDGPVKFGPGTEHALPEDVSETFGFKVFMSMALYPKVDKPWQFGIHQCSYSRVWTREEERLFQEIGRRLEDGLNTLLAHRNLRENMRKLEEVQRIAHIGHWDRDLNSDLVTLSEEACRIFGLPVEERTFDLARWQERWLELIHPDDRAGVVQAATNALQGSPLFDMEYRVVRPNGGIRIVHSFGEISRDRLGRSQRMFATLQDITDRKQAEELLVVRENEYRTLVENIPDLIVRYDRDLRRIYVNPAWEEASGMSAKEAISILPVDTPRIPSPLHPKYVETLRKVMQTGAAQTIELSWVSARGTPLFLDYVIVPEYDRHGKIVSVLAVGHDLTARKMAEDKLHRLNRELRAISSCHQVMVRAENEQVLVHDICMIICDQAGYRMAWVGYAENDDAKTIRPVAWAGAEQGYLEQTRITWADTEHGCGPSGTAIRRGKRARIQDFATEPQAVPWRESAMQRGYRSSIALPLKDESANTFGVLNVYSSEPNAFTEEEESLLEELSNDLAFGISVLRTRAERRRGEEALRESEKKVRRKLDAVLSPEIDIEALELSDIIDSEKIQKLMDEFYRLTNVGVGIIDLHGNVLVGTGWQDICTKFHRANPESRRLCIESDIELSRNVQAGTSKQYRCKHNMWEIATPIMLEDKHVGNIFLGQFLYEDEIPDYEVFRQQARRYGFKEEEYIAALERVPRWSYQKVDAAMSFFTTFGSVIGNLSYSNIKLANVLEGRKRAEEALKEREEFLSSIVENIPDMIFIKDAKELRFVRFNKAGEKLLGYEREDLVGKNDYDLFTKEQAELFTRKDMEVLESGRIHNIPEEPIDTKMGRRILHTKKIPILDNNGKALYLLGISEDITERKQAETELQKSNDLLRAIIEAAPTAIAGLDLDGNVQLVWNPAAEKMLGWSAQEVMGRPLPTVPVEKQEEFRGFREHIRRGMTIDGVEVRRQKRDGTPIDYSIYASPLHDAEGRITGNVCVLVDITDRKRADEALRASEKKFRTLFEESMDGVYSVLRDGQLTDANLSFCELFGYTREEMIGKNVLELYVDPTDRQRFRKEIEEKGFVKDYEVKLRKKDGTEADCLITVSVQYASDGSIVGYRGIIRDLTIYKSLQKQLLQAQKMESLGTLAGGIAHDFNNILQVIMGYSDMLLFNKTLSDPEYEGLHAIHQAGKDGAELAKRILAFSRKLEPNSRPINLNQEIVRVQMMLERTVSKMIRIEIFLADNLMTVNADPGQIEQILLNLAVNAQYAMPEGGRLTLETANITLDEHYTRTHIDVEPGRYVLLTVSDTGHGMEKEVLEHIFEPFYTTKEADEGTGLGLAMVFGIVKSHNGHISCYSEPGAGTTFKIYLPAITQEIEQEVNVTRQSLAFGTETILLVDDEKPIRKLGKQMLRMVGYTVLTATNGREALKIYRANQDRIALVLLDLMMPEMGGKQCLEELFKINKKVKVVIASGFSSNGPVKDTLASGAKAFVDKPYEVHQLLGAVREVLDAE